MEILSMCRICLANDAELLAISRNLQDMYEKLTTTMFKKEDGRPLVACYICLARLRNCYRLRTSCLKSDELLTQMLKSNMSMPQKVSSRNTLTSVVVLNLSLGHILQEDTKKEAIDVIDQQYTMDTEAEAQEKTKMYENIPSSHSKNSLHAIKKETDDDEVKDDITEEDCEWEAEDGLSSQLAHKLSSDIVLKRIVPSHTKIGTSLPTNSHIATKKKTPRKLNRNKQELIEVEVPEIVDNNIIDTVDAIHEQTDNKATNTDDEIDKQTTETDSSDKKGFRILILQNGDTQYQCKECNKCFNHRTTVYNHMAKHNNVKPYPCDMCEKSFYSNYNLTRHRRTHTGEKPFMCDICKKTFSDNCNYKNHIRKHTGEKPYSCEICNKYFIKRFHLKEHIRTHTGEKPFKCSVCNKCFRIRSSYRVHLTTHVDKKWFTCDVCNKSFSLASNLKEHVCSQTGVSTKKV